MSIAGGGEKTTFLASLRYQNDEGIIKESSSQIYSWRLKVDTKIKKWLKAGMNIYGHYRETSTPRVNEYDGLINKQCTFPVLLNRKMKMETTIIHFLRVVNLQSNGAYLGSRQCQQDNK